MDGILDEKRERFAKIKNTFANIGKRLQIVWPLAALLMVGILLLWERQGVGTDEIISRTEPYRTAAKERTPALQADKNTIVISNSKDEVCCLLLDDMESVLKDMRIGYDIVDISDFNTVLLDKYDKMILCITDLDLFEKGIEQVSGWVKKGGCLMNTATYDVSTNLSVILGKIGILEGGDAYAPIRGFRVADGFMIGGNDRRFQYEDEYWSNLNVLLDGRCTVYVQALDSGLPLLWECNYGDGRFIVINQTLTGKAGRGILASAYSLMDDVSVYPVINASAFYLDDFPSPVPAGNGEYIQKEYGMDISNFYSNVWWKDIIEWEKKYGIIHTGLIIEDYSDLVEAPFVRTESVERFLFFGNMLQNRGGELGFHGYNHMPLCLEGFDYKGLYDGYNLWETTAQMASALTELQDFSSQLFPDCTFRVYVPPSNILSEEGRETLLQTLPDIRAIASTYLPGDCAYVQEFGIAEDGVLETPRITSGAIMDDHMYLIAFSELNFHYVQSHFIHPDDVLDEDRGASLGWSTMKSNLEEYLDYIYSSAPDIRNVTGSGMADAVEDFSLITLDRKETKDGLSFDIGGFCEKASFLVRVRDGFTIQSVNGGRFHKAAENMYLLEADNSHVDIAIGQREADGGAQ